MSFSGCGTKSTLLHKIARKGHEHELLRLLRQGADVAARDAEGRTPLHLAVMRGHLGIIKGLLEYGGPAVLLSRDILNCTPVHLAAVQNQVQLISMLIAALLEDTSGCTPLHEVARRGCMQDFLGFLHLGWDIAACDSRNQDALQLTEDASKTGISAVQQTLGWSALHLAAMEGKVSVIEKMVKKFDCDIQCQSANTWTPLHYAAAYNQVGSIEALVRLGAKVDVRDAVGSTPMHVACGEGHLPAVLKLIQLGADPAAKDRDGCTPLYCASAWNRIDVVRKLHMLGCPSWVQSEEGRTAVHVAAEQGWVDLIRVLVTELGCRVDSKDTYDFTPLHSAANWGWVNAISVLVDLNHRVDVKDHLGRTPLHYAALHGRTSAIEQLLKLGASMKERDRRGGCTPLHLASDAGQCEAVSKLIELGADPEAKTAKGWTCLELATMKGPGNVDAIGLLVAMGAKLKPITDDRNIETPLHIAARAGRKDIVMTLIQHGAVVTAQTKDGSTPLHYAATFGQAHIIEPLVKAGSSVNSRNKAENTPLHLAAGCGFLDAVVKLVELGADPNARDMSKCTPLQNAAHGTYSAMAHVPSGVSTGPSAMLQGLSSLSLRRSGLSSSVLQKGKDDDSGGLRSMVPIRTGFAWASLGSSETLSSLCLNDMDTANSSSASRLGSAWKGAELMNLLRKATRGRRSSNLFLNPESMLDGHRCDLLDRDHSDCCHHHRYRDDDGDEDWDKLSHRELEREREGLELLLKKTEALQMSQMEQDRSRLVPVADKLVELGGDIGAKDNEGRTALHLAAGCGDTDMVHKLVELGADVNSQDSVGGTAMHHAAMADKKEMMLTLATLGCDWRAKAAGIDGASPAFVWCGQHGKTNRQRKLLEVRLKQKFVGGEATRRSGKECIDEVFDKEAKKEEDYEEKMERADANMAALLEEVAAEAAAAENKKFSSKRKNKKQTDKSTDAETSSLKMNISKAPRTPQNKDTNHDDDASEGSRNVLKNDLEEAINCANFVLEIGSVAGHDAMMDVREKMDRAINNAQRGNVGAKYAKKVRKKLQLLIEALPNETPKTLSDDLWSNDMTGESSRRQSKDDNEGWITAQGSNRRKQSSLRRNSGWQQIGQKNQKPAQKSNTQTGLKSNVMPKMASNGICTAQQMEETQKMVLASIPKPSEKAMIQSRIDADNGTQRSVSFAAARSPSVDSNTAKSPNCVWDQLQKPTTLASGVTALSGPDFPPLKSSTTVSLPSVPTLVRPASRKTDSDKRSTSQDSMDIAQKAEIELLEGVPVPMQSSSSVSSAAVSIGDQAPEAFPQYELFGSTASPALSAAMSTRSRQESGGTIKPMMQYPLSTMCPTVVNAVTTGMHDFVDQPLAFSGGQQGVYSQTETASFPTRCSGPAIPVMIMSGGYTQTNGYGPAMMQLTGNPGAPMNSGVCRDTMSQYATYLVPSGPSPVYALIDGVPAQCPTGHSPSEPVALQVAMECLNADEIADKLPKEIPGLVDSDQEEGDSVTPYHLYGRVAAGSPIENSGGLPRHLLGELESELEV